MGISPEGWSYPSYIGALSPETGKIYSNQPPKPQNQGGVNTISHRFRCKISMCVKLSVLTSQLFIESIYNNRGLIDWWTSHIDFKRVRWVFDRVQGWGLRYSSYYPHRVYNIESFIY